MGLTYEAIVSLAVVLFGVLIVIFPTFFSRIFRPTGGGINNPMNLKTVAQVYPANKASNYTIITGIVFIILGLIVFAKYGLGLF